MIPPSTRCIISAHASNTTPTQSLLNNVPDPTYTDINNRLYAMLQHHKSLLDILIPHTVIYNLYSKFHIYLLYSSKQQHVISSKQVTTLSDGITKLMNHASNDVYNVTQYVATVYHDDTVQHCTEQQIRQLVESNKDDNEQHTRITQYIHCNTVNSQLVASYNNTVDCIAVQYTNTINDTTVKPILVQQCQNILNSLIRFYHTAYNIQFTELKIKLIYGSNNRLYLVDMCDIIFDHSIQSLTHTLSTSSLNSTQRSDTVSSMPVSHTSQPSDVVRQYWQTAILEAQHEIIQLENEYHNAVQSHEQLVNHIQHNIDITRQQLQDLHQQISDDHSIQSLHELQTTQQHNDSIIQQLREQIDQRQNSQHIAAQQSQQIQLLKQQIQQLTQQSSDDTALLHAAQHQQYISDTELQHINKLNTELLYTVEQQREFMNYIKQQITYYNAADKSKLVQPPVNNVYTQKLLLLVAST